MSRGNPGRVTASRQKARFISGGASQVEEHSERSAGLTSLEKTGAGMADMDSRDVSSWEKLLPPLQKKKIQRESSVRGLNNVTPVTDGSSRM